MAPKSHTESQWQWSYAHWCRSLHINYQAGSEDFWRKVIKFSSSAEISDTTKVHWKNAFGKTNMHWKIKFGLMGQSIQEWTKWNLWKTAFNLKWYGLLKQNILLQIVKGCLPQIWSIFEYFVPYKIKKRKGNTFWYTHHIINLC